MKMDWAALTDNAPESSWKTAVESCCQHLFLSFGFEVGLQIAAVCVYYVKKINWVSLTKNG